MSWLRTDCHLCKLRNRPSLRQTLQGCQIPEKNEQFIQYQLSVSLKTLSRVHGLGQWLGLELEDLDSSLFLDVILENDLVVWDAIPSVDEPLPVPPQECHLERDLPSKGLL